VFPDCLCGFPSSDRHFVSSYHDDSMTRIPKPTALGPAYSEAAAPRRDSKRSLTCHALQTEVQVSCVATVSELGLYTRPADPGTASADPLDSYGSQLDLRAQNLKSVKRIGQTSEFPNLGGKFARGTRPSKAYLPTEIGDQTGPPGPTINKNNIKLGPKKQTSFLQVQIVK